MATIAIIIDSPDDDGDYRVEVFPAEFRAGRFEIDTQTMGEDVDYSESLGEILPTANDLVHLLGEDIDPDDYTCN